MGYRHSRQEILQAAIDLALEDGLGSLTFGRVAQRLGISDRMVVYYFPTKPELVVAVATQIGTRLQALLEEAFGGEPLPAVALARRAWPVLATPGADAVIGAFFEVVGLACVGREPFTLLAPALVESWAQWLAPRVAEDDPTQRRSSALAVMAQLDGLLLLRRVAGEEAAAAAAARLGVV